MGNYHETSPSVGYFLYTNGNQIFLRSRNGDMIGRAILLATDYKKSFSSVLYNESIYFCYLNDKEQLIMRSTKELSVLYHLEQNPESEFMYLHIYHFQNKLLLFYYEKNTEQYKLHCVCPLGDEFLLALPYQSKLLPQLHVTATRNNLYLTLTTDFEEVNYCMNNHFELQPFTIEQSRNLKEDIEELKQSIEYLQNQNQAQISMIEKQQQMIESAKSQYSELMHVATVYKEEAIKWRSKFSKEI